MRNTVLAALLLWMTSAVVTFATTLTLAQTPQYGPNLANGTPPFVGTIVDQGYIITGSLTGALGDGNLRSHIDINGNPNYPDFLTIRRVDGRKFFVNGVDFWSTNGNSYVDNSNNKIFFQYAKVTTSVNSVVVDTTKGTPSQAILAPSPFQQVGRAMFSKKVNGTGGTTFVTFGKAPPRADLQNLASLNGTYDPDQDHYGVYNISVSLAPAGVAPVPTPAAGGMLLAAFGLMLWGGAPRRRRTPGA